MHMFPHWHTPKFGYDSRLTGVLSYCLDIAPNTGGNVPVASPIFKDSLCPKSRQWSHAHTITTGSCHSGVFLLISLKRKYFMRAINKNKKSPLAGFYDFILSPTLWMPGIISGIVTNRTGGEVRGQDNTQSGKVMNAQSGVLAPFTSGRKERGHFQRQPARLLIPQQ